MTNFLAYSTDVPGTIAGQVGYGLGVTAIGVIIVFAVLILIMLVIYLFQGFFGQRSEPKEKKSVTCSVDSAPSPKSVPNPVSTTVPEGKEEELVAAIAAATAMAQEELLVVLAAAVAAQEGCDPATSRYRIRSFRRIL